MQSAIATAEELYRKHIPDRLIVEDIAMYLRHAFLVNYPDLFVMARAVRSDANWLEIGDPSIAFEKPDAWFVCMVVGQLEQLVKVLPFSLPKICFYRKWDDFKILKVYDAAKFFERITRLCHH